MKIDNYLKRTSVRDFDVNHTMEKDDIEAITNVINNAPTSTNSQQFIAMIITDQETKDFIAKNNWGQRHISDSSAFIVFAADRSRINKTKEIGGVTQSSVSSKHEFLRSTIDATIGATYAMDALHDMGYGTTMVGGLLSFGEELENKLSLPRDMFIVVGLSVGKATKTNAVKPKMNKVYLNKFNLDDHFKEMERYDRDTAEEFSQRGTANWIKGVQAMASDNSKTYTSAFERSGKYVDKKYREIK